MRGQPRRARSVVRKPERPYSDPYRATRDNPECHPVTSFEIMPGIVREDIGDSPFAPARQPGLAQ